MKIGIGIDTGGTCTDAVVYDFYEKKILASAKALTTKDDLSVGITNALKRLPKEFLKLAKIVSLSTTLATNACVENKGGRAKVIFAGIDKEHLSFINKEYINQDNSFVLESKTSYKGEIIKEPDFNCFENTVEDLFGDCCAVGIVEKFAVKTGGVLEKKIGKIIKNELDIPAISANKMFSSLDMIKRGETVLLNAKLIPIITEFIDAVKKSLEELEIDANIAIMRSDGSLMSESTALKRPIETIISGPVASLIGAVNIFGISDFLVVDMGGTTTDISFYENSSPNFIEDGVKIGNWDTFVKGIFVDTFGLGGDSEVSVENKLEIEDKKAIPFCLLCEKYPDVLEKLKSMYQSEKAIKEFPKLYVLQKKLDLSLYTELEQEIIKSLENSPKTLSEISEYIGKRISKSSITKLIDETVVMVSSITPTDIMHVLGDYCEHDKKASVYAVKIAAKVLAKSEDFICSEIYNLVKKKLYINIVRILLEKELESFDFNANKEMIIRAYEDSRNGKKNSLIKFTCPITLVCAGAPTHIFLKDVGEYLGADVLHSDYSKVANALGAVSSNITTTFTAFVRYDNNKDEYVVYGESEKFFTKDLDLAKEKAIKIANENAVKLALEYGCGTDIKTEISEEEKDAISSHGKIFIEYRATAKAVGKLKIKEV